MFEVMNVQEGYTVFW